MSFHVTVTQLRPECNLQISIDENPQILKLKMISQSGMRDMSAWTYTRESIKKMIPHCSSTTDVLKFVARQDSLKCANVSESHSCIYQHTVGKKLTES